MGCSASQSVVASSEDNNPEDNKPIPPPTSFEIPLELEADSLIKKHPPKRLEERLTKQLSPPQTISDLSDKLANAELRRQSILRERVNNIRNKREGGELGEDGCIEEEAEGEDEKQTEDVNDLGEDDGAKGEQNAN